MYIFPTPYTCVFKGRLVLCLKLFMKVLFGMHIDVVACNRLSLDRMQFGGGFKLFLEPPPCWQRLILLAPKVHSTIIHHLLCSSLPSVCSLIDRVLYYSLVLIRSEDLILATSSNRLHRPLIPLLFAPLSLLYGLLVRDIV
jgi:hypothetical protein